MPGGPKGERSPADVNGAAVMVRRIATGEIKEIAEKRQAIIEASERPSRPPQSN
jgi:hypothetical protein